MVERKGPPVYYVLFCITKYKDIEEAKSRILIQLPNISHGLENCIEVEIPSWREPFWTSLMSR